MKSGTVHIRMPWLAVLFVLFTLFSSSVRSSDNLSESKNNSDLASSADSRLQTIVDGQPLVELMAGCEYSYPPFCVADENGNADGFSVELLKAAGDAVGISVNFKVDVWDKLTIGLREGKLQVLPLVGKTPEREYLYDFTFPYTTNYGAIFVRKGDSKIKTVADLDGKEIVVMKGDTAEEYVRRQHLSSKISTVETYEIAMQELKDGKYDAVIAQQLMGTNLLNEMGINDIVPTGELLLGFRQDFCFAVRKGDKKLRNLLNEGLSKVIDDGTYDRLYSKWFSGILENERSFVLTHKEKDWLAEHPVIRLGFNPHMEPLLIRNSDGTFGGIYPGIFEEINKRLGINIEIVVDDWYPTVMKAKSRELDGLLANAPSQSKACNLLRTLPLHSSYPVIYVRQNSTFVINDLDDLAGKKIAYHKEVKMLESRLNEYKDKCEIIQTNSTLEAMKLLLEEKVDCILAVNFENYLIAKHSLIGLKIAYYDLEHEATIATGVRDDWPELVGIINKGINLVGPERIQDQFSRWTGSSQLAASVRLTPGERAWLDANPEITMGFYSEEEPYLIAESDGSFSGLVVDLIDIINHNHGTNITLVIDQWPNIINKINDNKIDSVLGIISEYADKLGLLKTIPLTSSYPTVYSMRSAPFVLNNIEDLRGKTISAQTDFFYIKDILDPIKDEVTIIKADSNIDALKLVFEGKADIALANSINNYVINEYNLAGMRPALVLWDKKMDLVIAVRKDAPEFVSVLNKTITKLGDNEINDLFDKWAFGNPKPDIAFSKNEYNWINSHPLIKVAFPEDMPPYSFVDSQGHWRGIFHDYLKLLNKRLGVEVEPVMLNWAKVADSVAAKELDMMPGVQTESREESMLFSDKFFEVKFVIISRNDTPFIKDVIWLKGKKVAVVNKLAIHQYLLETYPDMEFIPVETVVDGLMKVSNGQVDAFISDAVSASYNIMHESLSNLKIAASVDYPDDILKFGVRDDYPELVLMINKVLNSITPQEHNQILNKWMSVRYEKVTDWQEFWIWVGIIAAVPFAGLVLVIFWNRQLGRAVTSRTEELLQAKKFTEDAINSLQDVFLVFNPDSNVPILWNESMNEVTGYDDEDVRVNPLPATYFSDEDILVASNAIQKATEHGWATCELTVITKNGNTVPCDFMLTRVDNPDGSLNCIVVVGRDITERKANQLELERHRQHLEELVEERAQELNQRNHELVDAMAKLKDTQAQLILFEKLGALKHLVSGIAHEINSPLGAINSSREVLSDNLKKITDNVSLISDWLEGPHGPIVSYIIDNCFANRENNSSMSPREKRSARESITSRLMQYDIQNSEQISQKLIELHVYNNVEFMVPMLKEDGILDRLNVVGAIVESAIACDTIELAVSKASKIVNALNSYIRKGGNGNKELSMDMVDVKECLDNVLTLFYNAIKYTVTLDFDCDDDLPQIIGDSDELNQVWTNLIKNALDAMEGAGKLKIKAARQNGGILVAITDSGSGMTDEVKARIFEPLFTTKPAGEGTGLGMDIVRKIVIENHGGKINIDSELGKGTTISIWLPADLDIR